MSPESPAQDQAAGLRRAATSGEQIVVLGTHAATAAAALALAQGCTQVWGDVLVADPAGVCFSQAGIKPLFAALEARAVTEAAGCRLLCPPEGASHAALVHFSERMGSRALLYLVAGDTVDLVPVAGTPRLVVLGIESAPERAYAWLKALAQHGLLGRVPLFWLGTEAGYLRLAEAARRFLCAEIAGEICLPGADPACAARSLAARMHDGGQIWSRVRVHA